MTRRRRRAARPADRRVILLVHGRRRAPGRPGEPPSPTAGSGDPAGGAVHSLGPRAGRRRRGGRRRGRPPPHVRRRHLFDPVGLDGADAADRRPHRGRQAELRPPRRRPGQHRRLLHSPQRRLRGTSGRRPRQACGRAARRDDLAVRRERPHQRQAACPDVAAPPCARRRIPGPRGSPIRCTTPTSIPQGRCLRHG